MRRALAAWIDAAVTVSSLPPVEPTSVAEGLLGAIEARCFNAYLGGPTFAPGDDGAFVRALVDGLIGLEPTPSP